MLNGLFEHRLLIVLGKGGVGTTTVTAALARAAEERGLRVLAMECDSRAPMCRIFGVERSLDPVRVSEQLDVMMLDGRHALEEYLRLVVPARAVLRAVFASRLYQFFVQAAPGLKELMMLGKVVYESERAGDDPERHDLMVIDAPASGQALSMLRMPEAARGTFGDSVVGREASNISQMLRDKRRCAAVVVSTPEQLAVSETLETGESLREMEIDIGAVILNRSVAPLFSRRDIATFAERARARQVRGVADLERLANRELERAAESDRAFHTLARCVRAPILQLAEFHGLGGAQLAERLRRSIAEQSTAERAAKAGHRA